MPNNQSQTVDITPTPRILRILGDIPFQIWQCFAELMDNSLDAFTKASKKELEIDYPRIDVCWSNSSVGVGEREIEIRDNGFGMPLKVLNNAARAGFSSNDPVDNLGLFGMGFNIATARLGEQTLFLSSTKGDKEWVGISIDFGELIKGGTFHAPIVRLAKDNPSESGTRIIIRRLKDNIFSQLNTKQTAIRQQLEKIYSAILNENKYDIYIQGKALRSRPHCIWGETRYVVRKNNKIFARQEIDRDLGESYFDLERNRYLSDDESTEIDIDSSKGAALPIDVVKRSRRLRGWLGIQRYADPVDFGIDFIRNGRKILMGDKSLFHFTHPDTGVEICEYPIELGSTVGGRIVGELHVDYLIPTYQKNAFDYNDRGWRVTTDLIRGAGPILPGQRKLLQLTNDNDSPLGRLINAYRRVDKGTKCLYVPKDYTSDLKRRFYSRESDYISDEKWYEIAQECDKSSAEGAVSTPVDPGNAPTDDVDDYFDETDSENPDPKVPDSDTIDEPSTQEPEKDSDRDSLIQRSVRSQSLTGRYGFGDVSPMEISAMRVADGEIMVNGQSVPSRLFRDGIEVDFFYDPSHEVLSQFPITPKQLLLHTLSEEFWLRDNDVTIQRAFHGLVLTHMSEERINSQVLQDRADAILSTIRERLPNLLGPVFLNVKSMIEESEPELEDLTTELLNQDSELFQSFQESGEGSERSLLYVSPKTIRRLIEKFPEDLFDDKLFHHPYSNIRVGNKSLRERLRKGSIERIQSYFRDVVFIRDNGYGDGVKKKQELQRILNSIDLLESLIV